MWELIGWVVIVLVENCPGDGREDAIIQGSFVLDGVFREESSRRSCDFSGG